MAPPLQTPPGIKHKRDILMFKRDYRDMVGGALLIICGLALAWFASHDYDLGTLRRMGPGMFPMGLGLLLAAFGAILFIQALFQSGEMPVIRIWTPLFVLGGTAAFALLIKPFGLIPAICGVVIVSSLAELKFRPVLLTILTAALVLIAWVVFRVGLQLPLQMYKWPF